MSLRIERISAPEQLAPNLCHQWRQLPFTSPMQSPDWLIPWWETFGGMNDLREARLCVLAVYDGTALVAIAPWYLSHNWREGICLRFLGDGLVSGDHSTIVVGIQDRERVRRALSHWLSCEAGRRWQTIHFEGIDAHDTIVAALAHELEDEGCEVYTRPTIGTWSVDLPETWDDYLTTVSRNQRKRMRRWRRTYFESGRARVVYTPEASIDRAWMRMSDLNCQRRLVVGGRSAFSDQNFQRFHLGVLPTLLRSGKAQLRELLIDGQSVAVEYVLCHNDTVFCYQSGMETTESGDGYGNLSVLALFHDAIESGYRRIDFLRGDEDYKRHWGAVRVGCENYLVAAESLAGSAQVACYRMADSLRALKEMIGGSL